MTWSLLRLWRNKQRALLLLAVLLVAHGHIIFGWVCLCLDLETTEGLRQNTGRKGKSLYQSPMCTVFSKIVLHRIGEKRNRGGWSVMTPVLLWRRRYEIAGLTKHRDHTRPGWVDHVSVLTVCQVQHKWVSLVVVSVPTLLKKDEIETLTIHFDHTWVCWWAFVVSTNEEPESFESRRTRKTKKVV